MAKREFIEKEKVKKSLDEGWYRGIYPRNAIMCLHTFTEQDIVKPYLELLLKEMQSLEEIILMIDMIKAISMVEQAVKLW